MIFASQKLIHGYRTFKLILHEGKFVWRIHCFSDTPLLIQLPSNRRDKFMMVNMDARNDFYYLDFFESDLNGD